MQNWLLWYAFLELVLGGSALVGFDHTITWLLFGCVATQDFGCVATQDCVANVGLLL